MLWSTILVVTVVRLGADELEGFARSGIDNPAVAKLCELTIEEAERIGGLGLEAMRLFQGQIFGEPVMMSTDEVAKRLGISEEAVSEALEPIQHAAAERWKTTDEFKLWQSPENFSYANFSREANDVVSAAGVLAFEAGAEAVTIEHLRAALGERARTVRPRPGRTQTNFDGSLVMVLRRAHADAVGAGESVELAHLRAALGDTLPPA